MHLRSPRSARRVRRRRRQRRPPRTAPTTSAGAGTRRSVPRPRRGTREEPFRERRGDPALRACRRARTGRRRASGSSSPISTSSSGATTSAGAVREVRERPATSAPGAAPRPRCASGAEYERRAGGELEARIRGTSRVRDEDLSRHLVRTWLVSQRILAGRLPEAADVLEGRRHACDWTRRERRGRAARCSSRPGHAPCQGAFERRPRTCHRRTQALFEEPEADLAGLVTHDARSRRRIPPSGPPRRGRRRSHHGRRARRSDRQR